MHKPQQQVRDFCAAIGHPTSPATPQLRDAHLRARMLVEEALETAVALVGLTDMQAIAQEQILAVSLECTKSGKTEPSIEDAIDGLCDTCVIAYGSAEAIGVDLESFFDEVMRANMEKLGGPVREDGKRGKPPGWRAPDIEGVLKKLLDDLDKIGKDREAERAATRESLKALK